MFALQLWFNLATRNSLISVMFLQFAIGAYKIVLLETASPTVRFLHEPQLILRPWELNMIEYVTRAQYMPNLKLAKLEQLFIHVPQV